MKHRVVRFFATAALLACGDSAPTAPTYATADDDPGDAGSSVDVGRSGAQDARAPAPRRRIYGVTTDAIANLPEIVAALGALPAKPTTRIVFDEGEQPDYYTWAVSAIGAVSYVMGEILDSEYVATVSPAEYARRTEAYLAAFPTGVDLWEVGNEINGNWLGTTSDVAAKMTAAFDLVKAAGGTTELTLYGCSDRGASYDMFNWATANIAPRLLTGLDYVLVSYYEGDCGNPRDISTWPAVFERLHEMFPNAGVGFGEVGAVDSQGNDIDDPGVAGSYLQKYYGMQVALSSYVGGDFWWYFDEDMVPRTRPLFATLRAAIASLESTPPG